ncbi:type I-E CRISPR-associated endonuclease Cas1e [Solwaraspora sp. WMMD406]|uniref:type I-E CRISPR-associated endonuclease Cas1e n=1 Tax=Solwaraspora sp. WMMD406 TaxID=3016095 RepID=UPI002415B830|nr:type I-E CRISPR-associated endonuclease Cas1e [Solwaraspora sp. WMMD406]MDG4768623.1 type I-E CRISPR-associated endonuclease Cas1e [Solwaraspora sp. WMMD406]
MTSTARRRLAAPTLAMLPRVADSLSFLYADIVRIVQDDTGVLAQVDTPKGVERVYLPTAAISCLLLGPGTSITHRAMSTLARHGTTIVCVGSGVVRSYAGITPTSLTTTWLEKQVRCWADDGQRLQVATHMYERRFGEPVPDGTTLAQLRGMEGQRMKALYRLLAQKYRTGKFRRNYDPDAWDTQDPVNLALSAASACLYGVVHAVVLALGCSPALGFVHSGTQHAFVYDVADLYKAKVTVPLAFSMSTSAQPERDVRRKLRDQFRLLKLMPTIVTDIQQLLDPDNAVAQRQPAAEITSLWDPDTGSMPSGVNYGTDPWD